MTREELERSFQFNMTNAFIEKWYKKNQKRYTEEIENVFYAGAYSAQKYLIEKACEWLEGNAHFFVSEFTGDIDTDRLVKQFKSAMKE